jgi:hypothetical protein
MYHLIKRELPDLAPIIRKHAWNVLDVEMKRTILREAYPDIAIRNTALLYKCLSFLESIHPINKSIAHFCYRRRIWWRHRYPFTLRFDQDKMILDGYTLDRKQAMDIFTNVLKDGDDGKNKLKCHKLLPYLDKNKDKLFFPTDNLLMNTMTLPFISVTNDNLVVIYDAYNGVYDIIRDKDCEGAFYRPCEEEEKILWQ